MRIMGLTGSNHKILASESSGAREKTPKSC
jgi:hypothetical protein